MAELSKVMNYPKHFYRLELSEEEAKVIYLLLSNVQLGREGLPAIASNLYGAFITADFLDYDFEDWDMDENPVGVRVDIPVEGDSPDSGPLVDGSIAFRPGVKLPPKTN